jgi:hypothetical protein
MNQTQYVGGVVAEAGFDWLAVTVHKDHPRVNDVSLIIRDAQRKNAAAGIPTEPRKWFQYEGLQSERLFIGESPDRIMVQATSATAQGVFELLRAQQEAVRCGRIDVAVTTQHETDEKLFATNCKTRIREFERTQDLPRQVDLRPYEKAKYGDSLYIGSPTSDYRTVIYDKSREQKLALGGWYWRREVKALKKAAKSVFKAACAHPDQAKFCRNLVAQRLRGYGLDEHWMNETESVCLPTAPKVSDLQKELAYFEKYMKNKVGNLVVQGYDLLLLEALNCEIVEGRLKVKAAAPRPRPTPIPPPDPTKPRRFKFHDFDAPPPSFLPHQMDDDDDA